MEKRNEIKLKVHLLEDIRLVAVSNLYDVCKNMKLQHKLKASDTHYSVHQVILFIIQCHQYQYAVQL